jgi:nucleoside-diphosphate-sugar epimerase
MRNAIVAGSTGFIGGHLVERLRRELGPNGRILGFGSRDLDLTDRDAAFAWFERAADAEIDHVFHLAALYKAGDWPVHHPATQFFANQSMNVNMLEAWARFAPRAKFTSVVSYCMYPPKETPHPESELWGTEPEDYLFAYAFTKKGLLVGQRAYRQEHGLDCTSVVLPTIFGPGDSFAENSHVVGALIGKFVRAARDGAPEVEVWGDGKQRREFLFVEDAVDGILSAALHSRVDVLNIGTGQAHSVRELAEMIRDASGFRGVVRYEPNRFVGVEHRALDVTRARSEIGWTARTDTKAGIELTVRSYREALARSEVE